MAAIGDFSVVASLEAFWTEVETVFTTGFLGQPLGKGLLALVILVAAFVLRGVIAKVIAVSLGKIAGRTKTDFDDQIVLALKKPLTLLPIAAGVFFAAQALGASGEADQIVADITRSILIITVFWALLRLVDPLLGLLKRMRRILGETFLDWMKRIVKAIIFFIGGAAVLDLWGVPVLPFLASLSLLSVAVALGAQDLFKNLIGGMTIIGERRLSKGDWVFVDGVVEGIVEDVSFRSTTVRRFDKAPVYVPNAKLADNPLTNFSRMTHRRIYWKIGLEYRTTDEQLSSIRKAIEGYISTNDDFAPAADVSTFVHVDEFADSAVNIMVYCFTRTTVWGEWLAIKEQLAYFIKKTVESEGASFAFPSRSLYFEKMPDGFAPEPFEPPADDKEDGGHADAGDIPEKRESLSSQASRRRGATAGRGPHPHGRGQEAEGGQKKAETGDDGEGE